MKEQSFLEIYGALIVALIALIQPWIITLWKRYIRKGSVDFFETGNIEIGFSNFASTIGISGTLKSLHREFYISKIQLEVSKFKDSSKHRFEWAVFRDTKIPVFQDSNSEIELPYGILLNVSSPERVNIQYHDRQQQEHIRPIFDKLSLEWKSFLNKKLPYEHRRIIANPEQKIQELFEEFIRSSHVTKAYSEFKREFYWEKGDYEIIMEIQTNNPNRIFKKTFKFALTEDECTLLEYNVINLQDLACGQERYQWNFVYSNYK